MQTHDLHVLPSDIPAPVDDGAAAHLPGSLLPSLSLAATDGSQVDLSAVPGRIVVFAYPRTGQPGQEPLAPDWDMIPGARGCTLQTCGFRDLAREFAALGCRVFGLSTQEPAYQREMAQRLHLPFPVLSDADHTFSTALRLPTLEVAGHVLLKRLSWYAVDGQIEHVSYPVFPPDQSAEVMLGWIREHGQTKS